MPVIERKRGEAPNVQVWISVDRILELIGDAVAGLNASGDEQGHVESADYADVLDAVQSVTRACVTYPKAWVDEAAVSVLRRWQVEMMESHDRTQQPPMPEVERCEECGRDMKGLHTAECSLGNEDEPDVDDTTDEYGEPNFRDDDDEEDEHDFDRSTGCTCHDDDRGGRSSCPFHGEPT